MTTINLHEDGVLKVYWTLEADGYDFNEAIDVTNEPMSEHIPYWYEDNNGILSAEWRNLDKNLLCNYLN